MKIYLRAVLDNDNLMIVGTDGRIVNAKHQIWKTIENDICAYCAIDGSLSYNRMNTQYHGKSPIPKHLPDNKIYKIGNNTCDVTFLLPHS